MSRTLSALQHEGRNYTHIIWLKNVDSGEYIGQYPVAFNDEHRPDVMNRMNMGNLT